MDPKAEGEIIMSMSVVRQQARCNPLNILGYHGVSASQPSHLRSLFVNFTSSNYQPQHL